MSMQNTTTKIELGANAPQLSGLPEDLFDCDAEVALSTFAALCCSANVKDGERYLVTVETLALRQLALFAAGAQVKYHTKDLRDLERDARRCDHPLVGWVLRAAYDRAKSLGMAGQNRVDTASNPRLNGFAYIEPMDGRGYGELAGDLAAELFEQRASRQLTAEEAAGQAMYERFAPQVVADQVDEWTRKRLVTFAAVMSALKPRLCNSEVEAVVLLALYGAGARITLTAHQFDMLRMRCQYYMERMEADRYAQFRNRKMAEFALEAASKRAQAAGIVR